MEGVPPEAELDALFPAEQETLCSEFLRSEAARDHKLPRLAHLLLPVGRTMEDFDIFGLGIDGKRIYAQVTRNGLEQAKQAGKLAPLVQCARDGWWAILFCEADDYHKTPDNVIVFPIQWAFNEFTAQPDGKVWLDRVMNPHPKADASS